MIQPSFDSHASPPAVDARQVEPRYVLSSAALQALKECIVRLFTIPWSIWWGAALRLSDRLNQRREDRTSEARSEFPVFDWIRASFDGVIYLSWFFFLAVGCFSFLQVLFGGGLIESIGGMVGVWGMGYFSAIVFSLLKESTIIAFSIAHNVERIANRRQS